MVVVLETFERFGGLCIGLTVFGSARVAQVIEPLLHALEFGNGLQVANSQLVFITIFTFSYIEHSVTSIGWNVTLKLSLAIRRPGMDAPINDQLVRLIGSRQVVFQ